MRTSGRFGVIEGRFSRLPTGAVERRGESRGDDVGLASVSAWMVGKIEVGFSTEIMEGEENWFTFNPGPGG
jgi:hypothetical protein